MKTRTRSGAKFLGTLISCAVAFSMIPSVALADGQNGLAEVTFSFSGTVYSGETATANEFVLSPVGGQVGNNRYFGVDEYGEDAETGESLDPDPDDDIVGEGTFTFSIDPNGAYAGGEITKIVINISGNPNNMAFVEGTDDGWSAFQRGAFTWTPKTEGASFDEVSLTLDATTGQGHYFNYSSITITVRVPVDSITVEPDEAEENDFMYVDDDSFFVVATVDPETTTYDDVYMTWASSDEEVFVVDDYEDNLAELAPVAPGTATVTAALGGTTGELEITVYDHVSGATISQESADLYIGNTLPLTAEPTNADDVRAEDYTVAWVSDNTSVATVDANGLVTAVGSGEAHITATITDNGLAEPKTFEVNCLISVPEGVVTMHRLYNPNSGEHFYTSDVAEYEGLVAAGWRNEGIGWIAPVHSDRPVFRLYNENGGEHHYTMSTSERDGLVAAGWRYEGIGWYSADESMVPIYRQYNPNAFANNHNYTANVTERDTLIEAGWHDEQIAWYGILPQA